MQQTVSLPAEKMREPYALTLSRAEDALSNVSAHILISCKLSAEEPWKVRCEIPSGSFDSTREVLRDRLP